MRFLLTAAFLFASAVHALAVEPQQMRDLLKLMGFDVAMEAVPSSLVGAKDGIGGRTEEFDGIWDRTAVEVFPAAALFDAQVQAIAPEISDADWAELMAYFGPGGLGARVTEMENAAQRPAGQAESEALGDTLVDGLAADNPERLVQIERMMDLLGSEDEALAHVMNISYALVVGLASTGQIEGAMSDDEIFEMLRAQAPEMRRDIRANAIRSNAYTYRDLTNAEMDAYVAFLASGPAQRLYGAIHRQQATIMPPLVRKFGARVMQKMGMSDL